MTTRRTEAPKTVYEQRRENLTRLLSEPGAKTALAIKLNATQAHVTHLLKPPGAKSARPIHEDTARAVETAMGLSPGELDREPGAAPPLPQNTALLEESVRLVIAVAAESHAKLVADKTAAIVRLVYEHSLSAGTVDPAFVAQLVKLMR